MASVAQENEDAFIDQMMLNGVEFDLLGHVTKGSIRIDDEDWDHVDTYRELYDSALDKVLNS